MTCCHRTSSAHSSARRWRPQRRWWAVTALVAGLCPNAGAGALLARLGPPGTGDASCLGMQQTGSSEPVSVEQSCSHAIPGFIARNLHRYAEADHGLLRSAAFAAAGGFITTRNAGMATSVFSGHDVFSGPHPFVTVSLQLHLHGHLLGLSILPSSAQRHIDLFGPSHHFLPHGHVFGDTPFLTAALSTGTDWLQLVGTEDRQVDVEAHAWRVPTCTPVNIEQQLRAFVGTLGSGSAEADFGSTLTLEPDGPVVRTAAGVTLNGDGVIDKRWVGAPISPGTVPEPGGPALAAIGKAALARGRRAVAAQARRNGA